VITENMYFDTILKAIEAVLKAEAENQVNLGGTGWQTVRERFDPWNVAVDRFKPGVANVVWSASSFDDSESTQFDNVSLTEFVVDCYASSEAQETSNIITPKDQLSADVLHTLITKVFYTLMSRINIDFGLTPGDHVMPFCTNIAKFIPTESNIPVNGVNAARLSYRVKHLETPPENEGVPLEIMNVKSNRSDGVLYVEQQFNVSGEGIDYDGDWGSQYGTDWGDNYSKPWQ